MDAESFNNHNEVSLIDGREFIDEVAEMLEWHNLVDEEILDIGCGPGTSCPIVLLEKFPEISKLIGIDCLPQMITIANTQLVHEKVEFITLDIEQDAFPVPWQERFHKIVSHQCLHWIKNQHDVFERIFRLLKPHGVAALQYCVDTTLWDCMQDMANTEKWKDHLKDLDPHIPVSFYEKHDYNYYKELLGELGFEVIHCDTFARSYQYNSEIAFSGFLSSICGFTTQLNQSIVEEFKADLVQMYQTYTTTSRTFNYKCIRIIIRKPLQYQNGKTLEEPEENFPVNGIA